MNRFGAPARVLPLFLLPACAEDEVPPNPNADPTIAVLQAAIPPELTAGETAFDANCASCHGTRALGTDRGPPLVHIIYEPSHHADAAFVLAAAQGVRAHHWSFGDMPPVPGVGRETIAAIIAYVRHLQRLVGID
jgi:mono/diheme cytochrome c family protein